MQAVIYTVQPGDSLSLISKKLYGDFSMVNKLVEMNKITNPNLIHPGQQLLVPDVPGAIQDAVVVDDGQASVTTSTSTSSSSSMWKTQVGKWFPWIVVAAGAGILYYSSQKGKKKNVKGKTLSGEIEVDELVLYATNDGNLYRRKAKPIIDMLHKRVKKGTYDKTLAVKAWLPMADLAAKQYAKDHAHPSDWNKIFSPADRKEAAKEFERKYLEEVQNP